jgi:hypothetical protein
VFSPVRLSSVLLCFVRFPPFLFLLVFSSFLTSRVASPFPASPNQSQQHIAFVKLGRIQGKHSLQWTGRPRADRQTSVS